jgi:hypothetical protein
MIAGFILDIAITIRMHNATSGKRSVTIVRNKGFFLPAIL